MMNDLDLLAELAVAGGEMDAGVAPEIVAARAPGLVSRLSGVEQGRRSKPPRWAEAEDDFLRRNLGFMAEDEMAVRLGRSLTGVHLRWKRDLRLPAPSKHPEYLTANKIAKLLGQDAHKVTYWVDSGLLPGEVLPGGRKIRRVKWVVLERWLVNPANWIWFDMDRIRDRRLRRLCRLKRERWGDEWWTLPQVAKYFTGAFNGHIIDSRDVLRFLSLGRLSGVQAVNLGGRNPGGKWNFWFVRRSEVMKADLFFPKGKGNGMKLLWSDDGDAFMLLARAVGLPAEAIGRQMKIGGQTVFNRLESLREWGDIDGIIAKYELGIQRGENGELLADWREHRERFPRLARVMENFEAYLRGEYAYLRRGANRRIEGMAEVAGVLRAWSAFQAQTEEQRDLARRLGAASAMGPMKARAVVERMIEWGWEVPVGAKQIATPVQGEVRGER